MDTDTILASFMSLTNCDKTTAERILKKHKWDLDRALNTFFAGSTHHVESEQEEKHIRAPIPGRKSCILSETPMGLATKPKASPQEVFRDFRKEAVNRGDLRIGKGKDLASIFRPPKEIMFVGNFEEACQRGRREKKWLIVNILNEDFSSQQLNRDTWSSSSLKKFIAKHFIFWQKYNDTMDSREYVTFYDVTAYPHIAVLDPRTRELMLCWGSVVESDQLKEELKSFLEVHTLNKYDSGVTTPSIDKNNPVDMTEEQQLMLAIQASLTQEKDTQGNKEGEYKEDNTKGEEKESTSESKGKRKRVNRSEEGYNDGTTNRHSCVFSSPTKDRESNKRIRKQRTIEGERETGESVQKKKDRESEGSTSEEHVSQGEMKHNNQQQDKKDKKDKKDKQVQQSSIEEEHSSISPRKKFVLQIRQTDGMVLPCSFDPLNTLHQVRDWVDTHRTDGTTPYILMTTFPRKEYDGEHLMTTLQEAGLNRAVLILKERGTT